MALGGGAAPERALLDPPRLKALLPYIYIAEFEDEPFRVRYRLTGTAVDEWLGVSVVGHYLDEFLAEAAKSTALNIARQKIFDSLAKPIDGHGEIEHRQANQQQQHRLARRSPIRPS